MVSVNAFGWLSDAMAAISENLLDAEFVASVYLPIFDENDPYAAQIYLAIEDFWLWDDECYLDHSAIIVDMAEPPSIAWETAMTFYFKSNPPLTFQVSGAFDSEGNFWLEGEMSGIWEDAFGIEGFGLTNAWMEISLGPTVNIGLGAQFIIGDIVVSLYGRVGCYVEASCLVPDFDNILIVTGIEDHVDGLAISFRDVVEWWVSLLPGDLTWVSNQIPADWGLYYVFFAMSTGDAEFFGMYYTEGFAFQCKLLVFDIEFEFDVRVGMDQIGDRIVPNIDWDDTSYDKNTAEAIAEAELRDNVYEGLQDPDKLDLDQQNEVQDRGGLDFSKPFFELINV